MQCLRPPRKARSVYPGLRQTPAFPAVPALRPMGFGRDDNRKKDQPNQYAVARISIDVRVGTPFGHDGSSKAE